MTVAVDTTRLEYLGNGVTTAFYFPWRLLEPSDLTAWVNHIQRFDVIVTGGQTDAGGTLTFGTAPPAGQYVWLIRAIPQTQPYDLHEFDTLSAESQEVSYDRLTLLIQDLQSQVDRCIQFAHTAHITGISNVMPLPGAGEHIAWNFAGTRLVTVPPDTGGGGGGGGGNVLGEGADGQVTFWTGVDTISGDGKFLWDNTLKALTVGTMPYGPLKPGNAYMGLIGPTNDVGMQNLMLQTVTGDPSGVGLVTLGNDRVGISSWNFRGAGADNPIYGANFGVVFATNGVANGCEIDVQNDSATNYQGQALWLNGSTRSTSSAGHRANAILIDTQDGSKWERGILFKEGFVANGATGSIEKMGIHFEQSQDQDFIVIQPRLGTLENVAIKLTNPEFTENRFALLNSGAIRVGDTLTGPAFPSYAFIEEGTSGMYIEGPSVLGFAVTGPLGAGVRRMTLGPTLNLWPAGPAAGQGGSVNLYDPTSVHAVGFVAPDFVGNSFRIRLPHVPGTSGQCLVTGGPTGAVGAQIETWSYAACGSGGGGGGGTVTNTGVLALNQLVLGNGGVDLKPLGTLGTATTVLHGNPGGAPTFAQVAVADIAATGTPSASTFLRGDSQWAVPGGSGTVTTSGTPLTGQVPFYTGATVISGDPHLKWSNLGKQLSVGLPNDATSPSQALVVAGATAGSGDGAAQIWGAFTGIDPLLNPPVPLTLIGDFLGGTSMPTGFGMTLDLAVHDYVGHAFVAGFIHAGAQILSPPTTTVVLGAQVAGVPTALMSLDHGGALFGRQVTSQVPSSIDARGGVFIAAKSYGGGAAAANDGLGALIYSGEGIPGVTGAAAQILGSVDGTSGTRVKGRLTFHTSDGTTLAERMRINADGVVAMGTAAMTVVPSILGVSGGTSTVPTVRIDVTGGGAGVGRVGLALARVRAGALSDGFGPILDFIVRDTTIGTDNTIGRMVFERSGSDGTGQLRLQTAIGGVLADRLTVNNLGQMFYTPTTTTGVFGLTANGTQRSALGFSTNSNAQTVALIAPTAATGNHVWTLPTTLGVAGQVLSVIDSAGTLSWQSFPSTLTLTDLTITGRLAMGGATFFGAAGSINTTGGINTSANIGCHQYFADALPGGSVTKTLGLCTLSFTGGILTGFTGPATC